MAQFYTSAVTGYGVTVRGLCTYTESDVSTTNNTSKLTVGLKAYAPDGWRSIRYAKMTVTANGSVISTQTLSSAIEEGWDGTVIFADKALTVTHNNNGEATVNISVEIGFGTTSVNSTGSANFSLTTIARASTLTTIASSITLASTSGNNNIAKIVSKGNFYHKLQYSFNNSSWTNLVDKLQVNNTTSAWQVLARTTLLAGYPSDASGTLYLRVYTYSDSAESTQVGSVQTASIAIAIDTSAIKPSITVSTAIKVNSSPISGYLIAGHSSAKAGFTTTKSSGAASVTTYYSIPSGYVGTLVTTSSTSTSAVNVATNTLPSNTSATSKKVKIQAYAVDSRGAVSATATTGELTVYPYNPPKITGNFFRCVSTSNKTADEAGKAATGTFSSALGANASVNGQNTIQSTTCTYSKNGGTAKSFQTNGVTEAIGESDVVVFTVKASDKVSSVTSIFTVSAALFPIDLYQNGSNMGIGLGTIAVKDRIVAGLPLVHPEGHRAVVDDYGSNGGTNGYFLLCTIAIKSGATYCDQPIIFEIARRGNQQNAIVSLLLTSTNSGKTHAVNAFKASNYASALYVHNSAENVFQIYCKKASTYDNIAVLDYSVGSYVQARANITWNGTFVSALPDGCVQASKMVWDLAENANSATEAANAKKLTVTLTNPTDSAFRYLTFASGNNGNLELGASNVGVHIKKGTTSQVGWEILQLGNGTASGTAGNKNGSIRLYGNSTGYMELRALNVTTSKYIELPDYSGTVQLEPKKLYENATGTTGTVTLSETAANFTYLDIYYYTSHGSGSTPKRMSHVRVYDPDGQKVALTNTVYWSNELLISQSQIDISGKSITRLSNEQAQFKLTTSAASRTATTTNLYIYRVEGFR